MTAGFDCGDTDMSRNVVCPQRWTSRQKEKVIGRERRQPSFSPRFSTFSPSSLTSIFTRPSLSCLSWFLAVHLFLLLCPFWSFSCDFPQTTDCGPTVLFLSSSFSIDISQFPFALTLRVERGTRCPFSQEISHLQVKFSLVLIWHLDFDQHGL